MSVRFTENIYLCIGHASLVMHFKNKYAFCIRMLNISIYREIRSRQNT